jgi:uncharacterized Tic20 family protein
MLPHYIEEERPMTIQCPACSLENPDDAKFCQRCGAALPRREREAEEPEDRFKTFVAILIGIVSILGAVLVWRAATAGSSAADADVSGIVSTVSRNQARVATESDMYRNLRTYVLVRIHDLLSQGLIAESALYPGEDPNSSRLWEDAWTEVFVAEQYLNQVDIRPEYIRPDGSYDGQAAQDIDMAHRALGADFDPQGRHFTEADSLRARVQWFVGLALVLSLALLFYTLASVINHPSRFLFFALGSAVFLLVLAGFVLVELNVLGGGLL